MIRRIFAFSAAAMLALLVPGCPETPDEAVVVPAVAPVDTTPLLTIESTTTTAVVIRGAIPVDSLAISVRVSPPETTTTACANPEGLYCLPFAPAGLSGCAEMDFYVVEFQLPAEVNVRFGHGGFDSQPQRPEASFGEQGIGFRESSCNNSAGNSCCVGWWGLHTGNFTAPGYRQGVEDCGIHHRSDIQGQAPLVKQKQACMAKVMYQWWVDHPGSKWPWSL